MSILKALKAKLGDNYSKGDLFEDFVVDLFPESVYQLVQITPRREDLDGRWVEQAYNPDIQIRHLPSGHLFWVECKFRSSTYMNKLHWCEPNLLYRYKDFQESVRPEKVFVVAGLGGRCNDPESLYCIPLDDIQYVGLYLYAIERYKRDPHTNFNYYAGRLF